MPREYVDRQTINQRLVEAKRRKAEEGRCPIVSAPLGYHVVTRMDVMTGRYPLSQLMKIRIDPETERDAKLVFNEFLRLGGTQAVARSLNAMRLPTPTRRGKWGHTTVDSILRNTTYIGRHVYGTEKAVTDESRLERGLITTEARVVNPEEERIVIPCERLIDDVTFAAVQAILADPRRI
jgi:hypothetical protein